MIEANQLPTLDNPATQAKRQVKLSKIKKPNQKKRKQKAKNCDAEDMSMGKPWPY